MPDTVIAKAEHRFETLSAEAVYGAWLNPELVREWMTRNLEANSDSALVTRIEIDPVVGGRFLFADIRDGEETEAWGYYRRLEPGRGIVFTWFVMPEEEEEDNSVVTLAIEPEAQGCVATVSHEMDAQWADYIEPTARAWGGMLKAIDDTLAQSA